MGSEEQANHGVENSAKVVLANVENVESTSVHNDIQFEIPPAEAEFLAKSTCKVPF